MSWRKGQDYYNRLVSNIGEQVSNECEFLTLKESQEERVINYAKSLVPEYIQDLKIKELSAIHEYFMYMCELRPDPRFPTYVYSGGDRIISVTRYIQKHIDKELAKQYA